MRGELVAVCMSGVKGPKTALDQVRLVRGLGIEGDVHAGTWHRQISLLADERVDEMRAKGAVLVPGAFGENLLTRGIDFHQLELGRRFYVGDRAVLQLTQHGKECHSRCPIFYSVGDCVMPRDGVFARVLRSGALRAGSAIHTSAELDRYRIAVVTLSDRGAAAEREDATGPLVRETLERALEGITVETCVLPDDAARISAALVRLCDEELCDLVVTAGGTGLSPRDVTPEATRAVIDREVPGIAEAIRAGGMAQTPRAMLSRALCGQRGSSLILNLSGSPRAAAEQLAIVSEVLPHALRTATGIPQDCARAAL